MVSCFPITLNHGYVVAAVTDGRRHVVGRSLLDHPDELTLLDRGQPTSDNRSTPTRQRRKLLFQRRRLEDGDDRLPVDDDARFAPPGKNRTASFEPII